MSPLLAILDRMRYTIRWGRFLPILLISALPAALVHNGGMKFAIGMLTGIVVARFALKWEAP